MNIRTLDVMSKRNAQRIIGIDPGTNVLGYAVIEINDRKIQLITMGVVKMSHYDTHYDKLKRIQERISELIAQYKPSEFAIEAPFFGKNPQSMLKLGRAQGVAISTGITAGLTVTEYSPKKIKLAITGSGNSSKEQLASMLPHLVNMDSITSRYLDATDALATAVCHHYQSSSRLSAGKSYSNWSSYIKDNPRKVK